MTDKWTKMAKVASILHKNVLKLDSTSSLYLFVGRNMVNLNEDCGQLLKKSGEEDGILYLIYSHDNPF